MPGNDGNGHRRRQDHRPDRNIQFPCDHQKTNRKSDDTQRGRDVQPAGSPGQRGEIAATKGSEKQEYRHKTSNDPVSGLCKRGPNEKQLVWFSVMAIPT